VTPPGARAFTLGARDRNVPIGSLIDTTHGRVDVRAAPGTGSGQAAAASASVLDAEFYDGAFRIRQRPGAVTDIRLAGGSNGVCSVHGTRGPDPGARAAATAPHRVIRLLWGSGHSAFQTTGHYASATVRGTIWLTEDFCDGTLVRVARGVVAVDDLVLHRTVTVRAGHSYFARSPA
jgi:hypothetical protein